MCLNPKTIRNPTSAINRNGGQKAYIQVPCNNCAVCKKSARLAWRFRSHHHVKHCLNTGGFVYFDTLTYREDAVPRLSHYIDIDKYGLSDFYVFDNSHWRNFLKNLRRQLDYHYPGSRFTYFITSEYGTDERYTHRPHYHPLFFVHPSPELDNFKFSELVSKCWSYGRTDGLPYQTCAYVLEHTYTAPNENTQKLCNYVSKYVTKDSTFQKEIDRRLSVLKKHLEDEVFNTLKRQINMFHRQSKGFGLSFLDELSSDDLDSLIDDSIVRIEDSEKVIATLPLPMYYKRHLFYVLKRDDEGKYYWVPNELGLTYLRKNIFRNIEKLSTKFYDTLVNLPQDDHDYIVSLLRGRTLTDLATYSVIYKDRLRQLSASPCYLTHTETDNYIDTILESCYTHELSLNDVMHRDVDHNNIYVPVVGKLNYTTNIIDYDTFISQHIINEHTCSNFSNFDKILSILQSCVKPKQKQAQITFDFIEELELKFKHYNQYGY